MKIDVHVRISEMNKIEYALDAICFGDGVDSSRGCKIIWFIESNEGDSRLVNRYIVDQH